jgi:hypothetical protein
MFHPIGTTNGYHAQLSLYTVHELIRYHPRGELVEHGLFTVCI